VASTSKPEAIAPDTGADPTGTASPADEAERILGEFIRAGKLPGKAVADRFVAEGHLERVLACYAQAMREEPREFAYPWNLASSLDRLGLPDLALPFIARAVREAQAQGDEEFGGANARIAWADIAINADQPELAAVLLNQARALAPDVPVERYERKLRLKDVAAAAPAINQNIARKGNAVERLIAAHCTLATNFELSASTTDADDEGFELVFNRRGSPTTLSVLVKSRSWSANTMRRRQSFVAQVRGETLRRRPDLYLLFVAVDPDFGEYGPVWFLRSDEFADAVEPNQRNRLRFAASANPASRDRWSAYRLERSQLPGRILSELEALDDTT
jgi:hypothetical protein